ncbi:DUF1949 domain-containing protein, partial [Rhodococcus sp. HM1]
LAVGHGDAGRVDAELRGRGVSVLGVSYEDRAKFTVAARDPEQLASVVASVTSGAGELEPVGREWIDG